MNDTLGEVILPTEKEEKSEIEMINCLVNEPLDERKTGQ